MPQDKNQQPRNGWSTFSLEQKVGFVVFGVTGIVGLLLSFTYIGQQVKAPFIVSYDGEEFLSVDARRQQEIDEQKQSDTDGDGINDYEELNVYRTSPYLADSDSDGFDDGQEIKSGDDPNCPVGQDCGRGVEGAVNSPLIASDLTDKLPFEDAGLSTNIKTEEDINNLLTALSADDIRAALLNEGIDPAVVDAMSDKELQELFDNALKEIQSSGAITEIVNQ